MVKLFKANDVKIQPFSWVDMNSVLIDILNLTNLIYRLEILIKNYFIGFKSKLSYFS